jgi:hypothetical protein
MLGRVKQSNKLNCARTMGRAIAGEALPGPGT